MCPTVRPSVALCLLSVTDGWTYGQVDVVVVDPESVPAHCPIIIIEHDDLAVGTKSPQ